MDDRQSAADAPERPLAANGVHADAVAACAECGEAMPPGAHFCPVCGYVAAAPELTPAKPDTRRERNLRVFRLAIAAAGAGAIAIGVLFLASSLEGDREVRPAATEASAAQAPAKGSVAQPSAAAVTSATPSASPRPTATPTPVLPTPVLRGVPTLAVPATSPNREVIDTVNRSASAYTAALTALDESLLDSAFTGDALAYHAARIHDLRAAGRTSIPSLLDFRLVSIELPAAETARVHTRETWRVQSSGGVCSVEGYEVTYTLVRKDALWAVLANAFQQVSASKC